MYIAVLLKNVYGEPLNYWYLHFLNYCQKYHCPMITNTEFKYYPTMIDREQEIKYECASVSRNQLSGIEIYYVPDKLYGTERGMSTSLSIQLFSTRNHAFEKFLDETVSEISAKHSEETIEGFISFSQGYLSFDEYCKEKNYRVVRGDISPMRMNDGYLQNLYWTTMDAPLYGSNHCRERYHKFCEENPDVPILTRSELVALFGKEATLPLIPLMNAEPEYEMGICESKYRIDPHCFVIGGNTDDDLYFESRKFFQPGEIVKRPHPNHAEQTARLESHRNVENFILSARRSATVASNTMLLSMLWGRTSCCLNHILSCAFMAENDFSSTEIVDLKFLNWLIFAYLVPGYENFFSKEYWDWRYTYPSEGELYKRHLEICLSKAGLLEDVLSLNEMERLSAILDARDCEPIVKSDILEHLQEPQKMRGEKVNYQVATSAIISDGKAYYCRNKFYEDYIESSFHIRTRAYTPIRFIPLGDIAGGVKIDEVMVENHFCGKMKYAKKSSFEYFPKEACYIIDTDENEEIDVKICWRYKNIEHLLEDGCSHIEEEANEAGEEYHILLCADRNYLMQASVSICSVIENNENLKLRFHLFHNGVADETIKILNEWVSSAGTDCKLKFYKIPVDNYVFPVKSGDAVSEVAYFRILAPDIIESSVNRILYIDCDTVAIGDFREIFNTKLDNMAVACARGDAPSERKNSLGLRLEDQYFQSGVMLINLSYWREHKLTERILDFIKENTEILPRWDQDALNAVLVGRYRLLPQKWNTCIGGMQRDRQFSIEPVILHYTGFHQYKPWWKNTLSEWQDIFLKYKQKTPFADEELEWFDSSQYVFDETKLSGCRKAVLYGAGNVGKDFYIQNSKKDWCSIMAWVDKGYRRFEGSVYPVQSPELLMNSDADIVLVAAAVRELADEMKHDIIRLGYKGSIMWLEPDYVN